MKISIRKMGNSQGVLIPKPLLAQAGLESEAEMVIENGCIVLRRPRVDPREGWSAASQRVAALNGDVPVWPDFTNEADADLRW